MTGVLWSPTEQQRSRTSMHAFMQHAKERGWIASEEYSALHRWSVAEPGRFWRAIWDFAGIVGDPGATSLAGSREMWGARFFPEGRLNFAENLLRPWESAEDQRNLAILATNEAGDWKRLTRGELLRQVIAFARCLQEWGVQAGDRVSGLLPNGVEAVIAMLGAASIGAIWSCCSPDFGQDAIVDRFVQIQPKVFVTQRETRYNGKLIDLWSKGVGILSRLTSVEVVVGVGLAGEEWGVESRRGVEDWEAVMARPDAGAGFEFLPFPFSHPLYILYSSGTTGRPKCIVHGAGGTLLQHAKELRLHADVGPTDRLFYYTSTGWMMWNWLVSGLQTGGAVVLYDGSPLAPRVDSLFQLADEVGVTHFGASAKYYAALDKEGCHPKEAYGLGRMRVMMSTGSPLLPETFDYLYRWVKADMNLASISGGTDIVSCFVLGNPLAPVVRGQIQAAGLGMDVQIWDEEGRVVERGAGELVCATAFPSMPIGFWNDETGEAYRRSYFDRFPGVWCHGDWAEATAEGGYIIYGRSDATLNPGGIRIGTAEIYRQVEAFEAIVESLATALRRDGDEQIVLFVRMRGGEALDEGLIGEVKRRLKERCSPRHVPTWVISVPDIPRTISGKISELAVRNAIHGLPVKNESALANPESLEFYRGLRWEGE